MSSSAELLGRLLRAQGREVDTLITQTAEFCGKAQRLEDFKPLVDQIKVLFKNKAEPAQSKLVGLRLLHECMLKGNPVFLLYVARKMLSRLINFGKYRKEDPNPQRGATMFNSQSPEGMRASSEFLQLLLVALKTWASRFGKNNDGSPSPFLKAYTQLQRDRVEFPRTDPVRPPANRRPSPPPPPSAQFSLEEFINDVLQFQDAMTDATYQTPTLKTQLVELQLKMRKLEAVIQEKANNGSEDLEGYFEGNELGQGAIKRFAALPQERPRVEVPPMEIPKPIPKPQIVEPPRPVGFEVPRIAQPRVEAGKYASDIPKLPVQSIPRLPDPAKSESLERPPPSFNRGFSLPPQNPNQPLRSPSPEPDIVPEDHPIPKINQSGGLGLPKQQQFDFEADLVLDIPRPPQTERIMSTGEFDFEAEWEDPKHFQQTVNDKKFEFQFDDVKEEVEEHPHSEYLDKIEEHERTIEQQLAELKNTKAQLMEANLALEMTRNRQITLETQLQAAHTEIQVLNSRLSDAEIAPAEAFSEKDETISELQNDLESAKSQLLSTQDELKTALNSLNSSNLTIKNLQQKIEASEMLSTELSKKVSELNGKLKAQTAAQVREMTIKEAQYKAEIEGMREELEQLRESLRKEMYEIGSQTEELRLEVEVQGSVEVCALDRKRELGVFTPMQPISVTSPSRVLELRSSEAALPSTEALLSPIMPLGEVHAFQFNTGSSDMRAVNPFESFQQDQSIDTSIVDLLASQAFSTELRRLQPLNESVFPTAYTQMQGLLYVCEKMEVRFRVMPHVGAECDVQVIVVSKGVMEVDDWEVTDNAVAKPTQIVLQNSTPVRFQLTITALKPFIEAPLLCIHCVNSTSYVLKLPINFLRFTDPYSAPSYTVATLLESLSATETSQSFKGLNKSLRSMSDLSSALTLNSCFEVYSASKYPGLDRTSVLGCGVCLGKHILCKVSLTRDASGGTVSVYATSLRVRQEGLRVILSVISLVTT